MSNDEPSAPWDSRVPCMAPGVCDTKAYRPIIITCRICPAPTLFGPGAASRVITIPSTVAAACPAFIPLPDGRLVFSRTHNGEAKIWETDSGKVLGNQRQDSS